jgi:hypothetical protein
MLKFNMMLEQKHLDTARKQVVIFTIAAAILWTRRNLGALKCWLPSTKKVNYNSQQISKSTA